MRKYRLCGYFCQWDVYWASFVGLTIGRYIVVRYFLAEFYLYQILLYLVYKRKQVEMTLSWCICVVGLSILEPHKFDHWHQFSLLVPHPCFPLECCASPSTSFASKWIPCFGADTDLVSSCSSKATAWWTRDCYPLSGHIQIWFKKCKRRKRSRWKV